MDKPHPTTPEPKGSSTWEQPEGLGREHVQQFIQALLEEEVAGLLGRTKSARREVVNASPGYRNGYGKPRRLTLTNGTITVRRSRIRDLSKCFASHASPHFTRQTKEVRERLTTRSQVTRGLLALRNHGHNFDWHRESMHLVSIYLFTSPSFAR